MSGRRVREDVGSKEARLALGLGVPVLEVQAVDALVYRLVQQYAYELRKPARFSNPGNPCVPLSNLKGYSQYSMAGRLYLFARLAKLHDDGVAGRVNDSGQSWFPLNIRGGKVRKWLLKGVRASSQQFLSILEHCSDAALILPELLQDLKRLGVGSRIWTTSSADLRSQIIRGFLNIIGNRDVLQEPHLLYVLELGIHNRDDSGIGIQSFRAFVHGRQQGCPAMLGVILESLSGADDAAGHFAGYCEILRHFMGAPVDSNKPPSKDWLSKAKPILHDSRIRQVRMVVTWILSNEHWERKGFSHGSSYADSTYSRLLNAARHMRHKVSSMR